MILTSTLLMLVTSVAISSMRCDIIIAYSSKQLCI